MKYKPDWPEAAERWSLLWAGKHKGRPVMVVTAPRENGTAAIPVPPSPDPEGFWLEPDFVVRRASALLANTSWLGEAIPSYLFMGGWVTMAHDSTPRFPDDLSTIWFETTALNLDRPPKFVLDFNNPWLRKYERLHRAALAAAGRDDFLVGSLSALPGNDMLALMMGTESFLLNLADNPAWMREAILQLGRNWATLRKYFAKLTAATHDFPYGNAGWAPFWGPKPFTFWQSDISCMISPEMYKQLILPELEEVGKAFERVWYHLDGPDAVQHLPTICSQDYVRVVQYVPGGGCLPNGPAYLDLYKKIQQAGRIVHVNVPAKNVEPLLRELDPGLLCLQVHCHNEREARELLAAAERWTAARTPA